MAKINARGAHEVARWEGIFNYGDGETSRFLFLLRSDGKVLRRLADKNLSGGYSIFASFKPTDNKTQDGARKLTEAELIEARKFRVERMLTNKGYHWTPRRPR